MTPSEPPSFGLSFRQDFETLLHWRRDVRSFRGDPLPPGALQRLVRLACLAPSVGLSEPWRFVEVVSPGPRAAIRDSFMAENARALAGFEGDRARLYSRLKLAGLDAAPVQLAVFVDPTTNQGHGLGRRTIPETVEYSVVCAVHTLWLAARAEGIGVGWVSILDPARVAAALDVPGEWRLVAHLCIGYPAEPSVTPELQRAGWETRHPEDRLLRR